VENRNKFLSQPHVVYKKSEIKSASGLNLRSSEWMVLTQVNGKNSIEEIAEIASMQVPEVTRVLHNLFQLGLIEIYRKEKKEENILDSSFFINIEKVLTKIIGPVAPFVIEDVLAETNQTKSKFPSERVAELIELICDEIQDEQKKILFQSEMLNFIKQELI
jgi:DNA-binding Lrp family transcriptional regulator